MTAAHLALSPSRIAVKPVATVTSDLMITMTPVSPVDAQALPDPSWSTHCVDLVRHVAQCIKSAFLRL